MLLHQFVGDNAKVDSNTFKFIWAIYSGTPEPEVCASGFDEAIVAVTATVENEIQLEEAEVEVVEEEIAVAVAGEEVAVAEEETDLVDDLSDDEISENLLATSSDESEEEDEEDDTVDVHCRFTNFTLHDEWDGEAVNKSQGF